MQEVSEFRVYNLQHMKSQLNDMFKQVVVARDWKTHTASLLEMMQTQPGVLIEALTEIMLKVMVIPPKQQDSA
jgi:hypothetical protein